MRIIAGPLRVAGCPGDRTDPAHAQSGSGVQHPGTGGAGARRWTCLPAPAPWESSLEPGAARRSLEDTRGRKGLRRNLRDLAGRPDHGLPCRSHGFEKVAGGRVFACLPGPPLCAHVEGFGRPGGA